MIIKYQPTVHNSLDSSLSDYKTWKKIYDKTGITTYDGFLIPENYTDIIVWVISTINYATFNFSFSRKFIPPQMDNGYYNTSTDYAKVTLQHSNSLIKVKECIVNGSSVQSSLRMVILAK